MTISKGTPAWPFVLCFYLTVVVSGLFTIWFVGWENVATWIFDTASEENSKLVSGAVLCCCLVFVTIFWLLPGPAFFLLLIGFFCGFWMGWMFAFAGEVMTLILSCLLVQNWSVVRNMVEEYPSIKTASEVLAEEDVKFIVLFRFVTMPLPAKNYAVAIIQRPIWRKTLLSAPGILFYTAVFTYIGSKAHAVMETLRKGHTTEISGMFTGWEIVIIVISILATIGIACFAYIEYNRRLKSLKTPLVNDRSPPMQSYAAAPAMTQPATLAPTYIEPTRTLPPSQTYAEPTRTLPPSQTYAGSPVTNAAVMRTYPGPASFPVASSPSAQPVRYASPPRSAGAPPMHVLPANYPVPPVGNRIQTTGLPPNAYAQALPPNASTGLIRRGV